jgi:IPT/TIG domain
MFFDRPINRNLWAVVAIIICIILIGVAAAVLALNRREQAVTLLRVPGDYPTIQAAINAAEPADIIQVTAGTYSENLILDRAVTLTAETFDAANPANNATTIDGGAGAVTITIPANLTQMPIIRGFVIRGGNNGIQAASPFTAEFNFFNSSGIQVNYQWGAGGANRNNVYFKAGDDAIHLDMPDRPLLIENNRIMYAADDGIEVNLQDKPSPPGPVEIDIWNNMIIGNHEDGIQFIDFPNDPQDTNRRFVLVGNLIANSQKAGIGLMPNANTVEDYSGADMVEAIRVINNTFYGNNHGISGGDNLVAINNIITNSPGRGAWKVQGPPGANAVVAYTLFFNNTVDADQSTLGVGIITGQDPLFAAMPNPGLDGAWETVDDDFSGLLLQGTSPAIDKGVTQYAAASGELVPPNPLIGFIGAAPDLGWREFGSPIVITPTASPIPSPTSVTATVLPTLTFTPVTPTATVVTLTPLPTATTAPASPTVPPPTPTVPALATITITPTPQLNVLSITPNTAQANTTVNLTISGTAFANGATVSFEGGQGTAPQVTGTQVVNANTIVITVNALVDAGLGTQVWDVRVTNPNGNFAALPNAFTITVTP